VSIFYNRKIAIDIAVVSGTKEEGIKKKEEEKRAKYFEMQSGRTRIQTIRAGLLWENGRCCKNDYSKALIQLCGWTQNQCEQSEMSLEGKVSVGDGDGTEQANYKPNYTIDIRHRKGAS
jgi:hypothetical protein